jgi:hypothetical protein
MRRVASVIGTAVATPPPRGHSQPCPLLVERLDHSQEQIETFTAAITKNAVPYGVTGAASQLGYRLDHRQTPATLMGKQSGWRRGSGTTSNVIGSESIAKAIA